MIQLKEHFKTNSIQSHILYKHFLYVDETQLDYILLEGSWLCILNFQVPTSCHENSKCWIIESFVDIDNNYDWQNSKEALPQDFCPSIIQSNNTLSTAMKGLCQCN